MRFGAHAVSSLIVASVLLASSSCERNAPSDAEVSARSEALTSLAIPNPGPIAFGWFGYSVEGMSNGRLAVGAPRNDTLAVGSTPYGVVFSLTTGGAVAQQGDGIQTDERFGSSLAEAGGILVAGGPGAGGASDPQLIRWYDANDLSTALGSATGFHAGSAFGASVAIGGGRFFGGGPLTDNPNGPRLDLGVAAGYPIGGSTSDGIWPPAVGSEAAGSRYGAALAVVGTRLAVGGPGYKDGTLVDAGHVVVIDPATYTTAFTIANPFPAAGDEFGSALAYDGRLLIGAPKDDPGGIPDAGTVYLANPVTGVVTLILNNPDPQPGDRFGHAIASVGGGNAILVGAPGHSVGATSDVGVAYLFDASGVLLATIENPDPDAGDEFGYSVSDLGTSGYVIGAPFDDPGAVLDAGSVYVFAGGHAPTVTDRVETATEDTPLLLTMTALDPDLGDVHTWNVPTQPLHGSVSIVGNEITYTPAPDYTGNDVFQVQAGDGLFYSNLALVQVTVGAVNDPPVAVNDIYYMFEDQTLSIPGSGVVDNDSDVDSSSLFVSLVTDVQNGMLYLSASGGFTYWPDLNYAGPDSFTYSVSDGTNTAEATVTLTVNGMDDWPEVGVLTFTYIEDTPLVAPAGSLDIQDPDAISLFVTLAEPPLYGSVTLGTDGSFTYTPILDVCGEDSFYFGVEDELGMVTIATAVLFGDCVGDPPGETLVDGETSGTVTIASFAPTLNLFSVDPDLDPNHFEWSFADADGNPIASGDTPCQVNTYACTSWVILDQQDKGSYTFTAQTFDAEGNSGPITTVTLSLVGSAGGGGGGGGGCSVAAGRTGLGGCVALLALALSFVARRRRA